MMLLFPRRWNLTIFYSSTAILHYMYSSLFPSFPAYHMNNLISHVDLPMFPSTSHAETWKRLLHDMSSKAGYQHSFFNIPRVYILLRSSRPAVSSSPPFFRHNLELLSTFFIKKSEGNLSAKARDEYLPQRRRIPSNYSCWLRCNSQQLPYLCYSHVYEE